MLSSSERLRPLEERRKRACVSMSLADKKSSAMNLELCSTAIDKENSPYVRLCFSSSL